MILYSIVMMSDIEVLDSLFIAIHCFLGQAWLDLTSAREFAFPNWRNPGGRTGTTEFIQI
ncbi:MAG: hypothetical protein MJE63_33230 [Proteobacteria bacterium]|nr:hypothetical protein [Pseudomonadota bacterium]